VSKHLKWLALALVVLALALAVVIPTAAAPSQSTTGTISLSPTWGTTSGTNFTITVTDADLNVAVANTLEAADYSAAAYTIPVALAVGGTWTQRVQHFPILDRNADGVVNFQDVVTDVAKAGVYSVDPSGGLVTFVNNGPGVGAGETFNITYNSAAVNNTGTAVKFYSTSDTTGCNPSLNETGPNTGVFTGTFQTTTGATNCAAVPPVLTVANGAAVTASYTDAAPAQTVTASATIETTAPTIANISPPTGYASSTTTQTLFADITDGQSLVDTTNIFFYMGLDNGAGGGIASDGILQTGERVGAYIATAVSTTAISGGYRAQVTTAVLLQNNYLWSVEAKDLAGNNAVLDIDSTVAGSQAAKLTIDTTPPAFNCAVSCKTGEWWNPAFTGGAAIDVNKNTSLSVRFDSALMGSSVNAADFTVAGSPALDAFWTSSAKDYVFLTVPALAANATPIVAVVGTLQDASGNVMVLNSSVTIHDGIAPTLTVSLNKTLTIDTVIATIVSNEPLGGLPTVALDAQETPAGAAGSPATVSSGVNQWTWTYTPGKDGSYAIKATGLDTSGNSTTVGVYRCASYVIAASPWCNVASTWATKGIVFERDANLQEPTVTAGGQGLGTSAANLNPNVYSANPFIVVDFTPEGKEYGYDAGTAPAVNPAEVTLQNGATAASIVVNTDTHSKGAITVATLDGVALTMSTDANSVKFIAATSGLAAGSHTLVVNGTDDAANTGAANFSYTFVVKARPNYSITIYPGMNLISFPTNPSKTGLADITSGTGVDLIVTYDPANPAGPWLIAQKGTDGNWTGTLSAVDNVHGYWVRSSTATAISFAVPDRGFQELPPAIPVVAGYNLLPVSSIAGSATVPNYPAAFGSNIASSAAFAGVVSAGSTQNIYGFNPLTGTWMTTNGAGNVQVGYAYWVYASSKGTVTP